MTEMYRVAFLQWAQPQMGFKCSGFRKVHGQVCKPLLRRMAELGDRERLERLICAIPGG